MWHADTVYILYMSVCVSPRFNVLWNSLSSSAVVSTIRSSMTEKYDLISTRHKQICRVNPHLIFSISLRSRRIMRHYHWMQLCHCSAAEWKRNMSSGSASAAKQPGHLEVRTSSSQVNRSPSKHKGRQRRRDCFTVIKNKTNKAASAQIW